MCKNLILIVFFISFSVSVFSFNNEFSKKIKFLVKLWSEKINLVDEILKFNYLNYGHLLLYLYENEVLESKYLNNDEKNKINQNKFEWKNKYFFLLKYLKEKFIEEIKENDNENYQKPHDFNLIIIVRDIISFDNDFESYAEIFINRRYMGKTLQGLQSQKKIIKLKVASNIRHMLKINKYQLNLKKNKWQRVHNLKQPKVKYFNMPNNRIRVIEVIYNSYQESAETDHLKYQYKTFFLKKNQELL